MAKLTLAQLERHLFAAADILRGTMDAAEYRDFLLILLFLKRVNDEFESARDAIIAENLAQGRTRQEAQEEASLRGNYTLRKVMYVPEEARWNGLAAATDDVATRHLQPALDALAAQKGNENLHGLFNHVNFNRIGGGGGNRGSAAKLADQRLRALIEHFGSLRLRGEDFEFPDVIGAAYEYLLKDFADSAGAKGGEFYTPRAVVRMMVELARPRSGQRIYDPCVGSGGMLIHAKEYVEEHGEDADNLHLAGQDANSGSWVMATMNMLFHGAQYFSLKTGDTLTDPQHPGRSYHVVLSNPPFSMDYKAESVAQIAERMPYGQTSERGKADLMFLQHMLHMAEGCGGSVFTVMPHGVLFRGGAEERIRAKLIERDLLEAVIGLPPNLFYGTGIPACVLVLRTVAKRSDRQKKVLFINADREYYAERAQNVLLPEHVEKIVSTFHASEAATEVEGFSKLVDRKELAENDYNLNIRRYVDNTPPPEPQDVRAHLVGGVPKAEVEAKKPLLDAYGVQLGDLFAERDDDPEYVDFLAEGKRPDAERLTQLARQRETVLWKAFEAWWTSETEQIAKLPSFDGDDRTDAEKLGQLARLRGELITSFRDGLLGVGLLDRYALAGAVAGWWQDARNDLKALLGNGWQGVVDGWVETVETMLRPEPDPWTGGARERTGAERRQAYDHKIVAKIAPEFLEKLATADRHKADLDTKVKAAEEAKAAVDAAEAAANSGEEAEPVDPAVRAALLSDADLKKLKKERTAAGNAVKELEHGFWPLASMLRAEAKRKQKKSSAENSGQTALAVSESSADPAPVDVYKAGLHRAREALDDARCRAVVLDILRDDLASKLEGHVVRRRRELVDAYRLWEDKYAVSLHDIERQREAAAKRLNGFLKELGYVG